MVGPVNRTSLSPPTPSQDLNVPAAAKTTQGLLGELVNQLNTVTTPSQGPSTPVNPSDLEKLAETIKALNQFAKHIVEKLPC